MKTLTQINNTRANELVINTCSSGLPVRTNLRAGLAWDDIDDKAKELLDKLTSAISSATSALTGSGGSTPAA